MSTTEAETEIVPISDRQNDFLIGPAKHDSIKSETVSASQSRLTNLAIPIVAIHVIALLAFWPGFMTWTNLLLMLIGSLVFGQGMNLGYHRLLAHRSLKVPKWLEYFYVTLALCSLEETPGKWVSTHRRHHNHSDEDDDPHSPENGFWWSHMGWLLFKRNGQTEFQVDSRFSADILDDPFYQTLERRPELPALIYLGHAIAFYVLSLIFLTITGTPLESGVCVALGMTWWGVFLRTVVVWHITWSVNSLSHVFGYQNYETGEESRNNWLVALIASGEGWHNNHHADPASASVQHKWWEFDLTYYHIRLLEMLGLAKQVIRPRHVRRSSDDTDA